MLHLQITIPGAEGYDKAFDRLMAGVDDLSTVFHHIADVLTKYALRGIETQGRVHGAQWAELNDDYKKWKNKNYPGQPIMILTGALKASLKRGGAQHVEEIGKDSMVWGTDVHSKKGHPYPLTHQMGSRPGKKPMIPQRLLISAFHPRVKWEITHAVRLDMIKKTRAAAAEMNARFAE